MSRSAFQSTGLHAASGSPGDARFLRRVIESALPDPNAGQSLWSAETGIHDWRESEEQPWEDFYWHAKEIDAVLGQPGLVWTGFISSRINRKCNRLLVIAGEFQLELAEGQESRIWKLRARFLPDSLPEWQRSAPAERTTTADWADLRWNLEKCRELHEAMSRVRSKKTFLRRQGEWNSLLLALLAKSELIATRHAAQIRKLEEARGVNPPTSLAENQNAAFSRLAAILHRDTVFNPAPGRPALWKPFLSGRQRAYFSTCSEAFLQLYGLLLSTHERLIALEFNPGIQP